MGEKKEVKSKIDRVKELAALEHSDIQFITGGNVEGSTNQNEFAIATNEGLFFYHYKNEKLIPLIHTLWKDVNEIKVDYLAMRTNLTLDGQNYRLTNDGKKIFNLAAEKSDAIIEKVDRKWHQKILGFRSGAKWKKITAVIAYLFLFGFIGSFFIEEEETRVVAEDETEAPVEVAAEETEVSAEAKEAEAKEKEAELKRIEEIAAAEEKKKAEDDAAAAEEKALAEEKEAEKDAAVLDSFNKIRTEMINQGSGVVDMDIAKDPSYYQIKVIVDESVWANSTESQKMSFVTTLSTVIEDDLDETFFYDVYSNINEDIVATTGILGKWKIKR